MFIHTLVAKKEIDLDELIDTLEEDSVIIETMRDRLGALEYSFVVDCVKKQVEEIKEYTPMPIE